LDIALDITSDENLLFRQKLVKSDQKNQFWRVMSFVTEKSMGNDNRETSSRIDLTGNLLLR
jgi:hypothetical protein